MPIIPHFSNEALENLNMQNLDLKWPTYDKKILDDEKTKIVIQINGKKEESLIQKKELKKRNFLNLL